MANTLSVREGPRGGSVAPSVVEQTPSPLALSGRLVILIHGFDNSPAKAASSYRAMKAALTWQLPAGRVRGLGAVWEFFWPSDQSHWPLKRFIKSYRSSLGMAEQVGARLGEFLKRHHTQQICLIGHSMGCRVALEALKFLDAELEGDTSGAYRRRVILLAAAVPVRQCTPGSASNRFGARRAAAYDHVLHSRNDRVLHYLFPLGQPDEIAELGPAVGFSGAPAARWTSSYAFSFGRTRGDRFGLGRGQYWSNGAVAKQITTLLGLKSGRFLTRQYLPDVVLPAAVQEDSSLPSSALPGTDRLS